MKIIRTFYTLSGEIKDQFVEKYNLSFEKEKSNNDFLFFTGDKDDENIYVLLFIREKSSLELALEVLSENFLVFHHTILSLSLPFGSEDMQEGDIVTPYTFLMEGQEEKALFLENIVGENISFPNFGLILNGISFTGDIGNNLEYMSSLSEKYGEGTYNDFVYRILAKLITQMGVKQEEITVLEQIHFSESKEVSIDNMLLIYDTIVN